MTLTSALTPRVLRSLAAVCVGLVALLSFAAEPAKQTFDLPAGDAESTLKLFTQQSGEQILYPPARVSGVTTNAVKGEMTSADALDLMLAQTSLIAVRDPKTRAFTIQKALSVEDAEKNGARAIASSDRPDRDRPSARYETDEQGNKVLKLDTFEVMGSKLLNMDLPRSRDDAQPYVVFDRQLIERSGASSIEDLLKTRLSMNTQGQTFAQDAAGTTQGARSQVNLRGFGSNQTLILVDGRRVANAYFLGGSAQPDLNGIPLSAVERIEILPSTASGIHGGNATGGVVNVILRRDYAGVEAKVTYENTFSSDAPRRRLDLSAGFTLEGGKTNVLLLAHYSDQGQLSVQDRDFVSRGRARILANNPAVLLNAATPPLGGSVNIRSSDGSNLSLKTGAALNSPRTFVPAGYSGPASDQGNALVANAGNYDLSLSPSAQLGRQSLLLDPRIESIAATFRRQWSPSFQLFAEASASNNTSEKFISSPLIDSFLIPAAASTNPFNQAIRVSVPTSATDQWMTMSNRTRRAALGAIVRLPRDWIAEADYTWNRSVSSYGDTGFAATAAAAVTAGTLNVIRDAARFPLDFSPYLQPFNYTITPFRAELRNATLRASGPALELPAGPIRVSALLEHSQQDFQTAQLFQAGTTFTYPARRRTVQSAYAEIRWPLLGHERSLPLLKELELQTAVRFDEYKTQGANFISTAAPNVPVIRATNRIHSANPTLGLVWKPHDALILRASYGTGFLPADINQLTANAPIVSANGGVFVDPRRGNEQAGAGGPFTSVSGGNPDLRPEESTNASAGVVWQPSENVRVSLDWSRIQKKNNILTIGVQNVINNEALFPSRVTRLPAAPGDPFGVGPITIVDNRLVNVTRAEAEAFDLAVDYRWKSKTIGTFDFFASGTRQTHYKVQLVPGQPLTENVGLTFNNPAAWKASAGLAWSLRAWTVQWGTTYSHKYLIANPAASANAALILAQGNDGIVPHQVYHDLSSSYRFGTRADRRFAFMNGVEIQAGIRNVFNQEPPVDLSARYFYSPWGDPRLVSYYVALKRTF